MEDHCVDLRAQTQQNRGIEASITVFSNARFAGLLSWSSR